jgi:hypothetical protein
MGDTAAAIPADATSRLSDQLRDYFSAGDGVLYYNPFVVDVEW